MDDITWHGVDPNFSDSELDFTGSEAGSILLFEDSDADDADVTDP